jgi:hypothetical protein
MASGSVNYIYFRIELSAVKAAPEAVYQIERYAQEFAYRFSVPTRQQYRVHLLFAEIFDDEAGKGLDNIVINGQPALKGFDIFVSE